MAIGQLAQTWSGHQLWAADGLNTTESLALTNDGASSVWVAFGFKAPLAHAGLSLKSVTPYFSAVSGSPKAQAVLYSSTGTPSVPNAALQTGSEVDITGAGNFELGGFTQALTPGAQYYVVIKCTSGTSATINYKIASFNWYSRPSIGNSTPASGYSKVHSADAGSTWAGTRRDTSTILICLTDGTDDYYIGTPLYGSYSTMGLNLYEQSGVKVELGARFKTPAYGRLRVHSAGLSVRRTGSPAGSLIYKLYEDTTLLATSEAVDDVSTAGEQRYLMFDKVVELKADTVHRLVAANTAADDSSNYYWMYGNANVIDSDGARSLLPFHGTAYGTKYTVAGWTDMPQYMCSFALLGDFEQELGEIAGGGPLIGSSMIRGRIG